MPRQPRLDAPGALHHVMSRGIDGIKIFSNRKNREDFLERLADLCEADALSVYAWALMSNHFHLLLRTGNHPLSNSMRKLLTGYVVNYNRRHKRYGQSSRGGSSTFSDPIPQLNKCLPYNLLKSLSTHPWSVNIKYKRI